MARTNGPKTTKHKVIVAQRRDDDVTGETIYVHLATVSSVKEAYAAIAKGEVSDAAQPFAILTVNADSIKLEAKPVEHQLVVGERFGAGGGRKPKADPTSVEPTNG